MRIFFTLILVFFATVLPWWGTLVLLATLMVYYPHYWEGILVALFFDALYGSTTGIIPHLAFSMTLIAIVFYGTTFLIRHRLFKHYAL